MEINSEKLIEEIKKAKNNEQIAFSFLLNTFWKYVYDFQLKKVDNDNDAEDITVQTFSKAFDKISTFNEKYQFKTWLIAISKNVYIDFLRKKKSSLKTQTTIGQEYKMDSIIDDEPTPENKIILEQNLSNLLLHIKQLKPKYQEVIQLRFFQELSYKEISEQTNQPISNVKVKLMRAKKLLAEIINKSKPL